MGREQDAVREEKSLVSAPDIQREQHPPAGSPLLCKVFFSYINPVYGNPGDTITINGVNFGDTRGIVTFFDGIDAREISSWSDSEVVLKVPAGVSPGPVVVTASGRQSNQDVSFTISYSQVLSENFDSYPSGPLSDSGSPWYGDTSVFHLVTDAYLSSPNSLYSSVELADVFLNTPPVASGQVTFYVRFADFTYGNEDFVFTIENSSNEALADIELFDNHVGGGPNPQIQFQYYSAQPEISPYLSHLLPNTWYKVAYVWRASDNYAQLYLNDQLAVDWSPPAGGCSTPISVVHLNSQTGDIGKAWYDNISIVSFE